MDNGKDSPPIGLPARPALLAYLPYLWSQVLFPGTARRDATVGKTWLWLVIIPALFLYPSLSFHLFEPDEGRYAEIPREMLARGDWIVPWLLGEPYLDKPPLFYWLVMASFRVLGTQVWTARLVPALALHGCVLLTYFLGRRIVGARAAFWAALLLSLTPGFLCMGRLLILDGVLAFCVTLAALSGFEAVRGDVLRRGWWLLSALGCGLALLTKGPVALILVVPPLLAHRILMGGPTGPLNRKRWAWPGWQWDALLYAAVVLAVVLPWFIAICVRAPAFAVHFLWEHNIVRFVAPFDHIRPVWFYVPILLLGMLPASLLLAPLIRFLLSGDSRDAGVRSPELGFLLLAGSWCVLFFSLSGSKLPTYILPAFPLLSLAVGAYLAESRWLRARWLAAPLTLAVIALGAINYGFMPWYAKFHSPLSHAEAVASYCADPEVPVICYPRNCDSVAFFLGRDDLRSYRSKATPDLIEFMKQQRRTVIIFTHRHSLEGLRQVLPKPLRLTAEVPISGSWRSYARPEMCYMAVVEGRK